MQNDRLITVLLVLTLGQGCSEEAQLPETPVRSVLYERATLSSSAVESVYSGVTQAHLDAQMSFKVAGTVLSRPVDVGDRVAAGDLLARLDERDYTSAVEAAKAELASGRARARQADANYERLISLYETRNAAQAELEVARASNEAAKANVTAAAERLRQAELQLSYTRLQAPQACEVAETYVRADENVNAGTPVVRLTCGDCPEVRVSVPQTRIRSVESGMRLKVDVSGFAGGPYEAIVSEVGVATGSGATFPVTAIFSGNCPDLRSGIAADVHFEFPTGNGEQLTVPSVAVGEDDAGRFIYVLEPTSSDDTFVATRRDVEVGAFTEAARFVVSTGLGEGELVATAGVRRIQHGQRVRLASGLEG